MTQRSPPQEAESSAQVLAPKSMDLEFGGVAGALFISTAVPLTIYYLTFGCSDVLGCAVSMPLTHGNAFFAYAWNELCASFTDPVAWGLYGAWYAYCVLAWLLLPGRWVKGLPLRTGKRLDYKLNALQTGMLALGIAVLWVGVKGAAQFTFLYDHWPGLVSASLANAVIQACYVYAGSFHGKKLLALGGNSGNIIFDWFIGRELNPRIGRFDIKTFNELRPGLILWVLLDLSCACKQYTLYGYVSASMLLVLLFHTWYVVDSLLHEETIFSQMDITSDGFGFMLSVGDLAWLPFTYSLQARYLAFTPVHLSGLSIAAILALQALGFYIFRTANVEKNDFRSGRNPKNLEYMTTASGRKLITSGWWGTSRHPNYLGDWLMAWAWCLPCGFATPLPYFYVVYFAILLLHRQLRDDEACKKKYGADWDVYCSKVPWRIIPYIY